jgi:hypothetical protein
MGRGGRVRRFIVALVTLLLAGAPASADRRANAQAEIARGHELLGRGDAAGAIARYHAARTLSPESPGPYLALGIAHHAADQCERALSFLDEYLLRKANGPPQPQAMEIINTCKARAADRQAAVALDEAADVLAPSAKRVALLRAAGRTGQTADEAVLFDEDRCYVVIVIAGTGVRSLHLALASPQLARLADSREATPRPSLQHCVRAAGRYRFSGRIAAGSGEYAIGVYRLP